MYPSIYLCIYLSIYVSICLSMYLPIYLSTYLCIHLSMYLSTYPYIYLLIYVCIHPSIYLCINLSMHLSIYLSICLPVDRDLIYDFWPLGFGWKREVAGGESRGHSSKTYRDTQREGARYVRTRPDTEKAAVRTARYKFGRFHPFYLFLFFPSASFDVPFVWSDYAPIINNGWIDSLISGYPIYLWNLPAFGIEICFFQSFFLSFFPVPFIPS